ncbi:MAG: hypothetical protein IT378_04680, partial [Sandaracinaceae bacterium]|nr:hypothetical protein [Sandaracinaceae bacterium]
MSERVPEVSVGQNGARIAQLAIILSSLIACGESPAPHAPPPAPVVDAGPELAPRLPNDEGPFYPSQVRLAEERADVERLADVGICTECHADSVAQHNASAHARSSFDNPWYRAVVDRVRQDAGFTASRHCAGCHDPLLLVSGAMDRPIEPSDPLARAGITCLVCHGIVETNTQGNASYTLSSAPIPIPDPADEEEVAAHRARLAPAPLRTPGLCGSCHRGFLGTHTGGAHFLPGIDEIGPWRGSAWGDQQAQRIDDVTPPEGACRGCHMPSERIRGIELAAPEGFVASHRFAGGHSALAAHSGDASQLAAVEARQRSAATIDVAALVHEDGRRDLPVERGTVTPGERVTFDVVIRNQAAGHFFPGGARDLRDHWVAVRVRDARGRVIAQAGTEHAERVDPSAFVLGTGVLDEEGRI